MVREKYSNIISCSRKMDNIFNIIEKVAPTTSRILIQGESGTGKELIAKAIHINSKRSNNVFLAVNCACIPSELMESELFGYERGAFTGAKSRTIGKFEAANEGTLFLDEISSIPLHLQAKLLRVLQEKEITRLGSNNPIKINVRIIAASNDQLDKLVQNKVFREDLYYRLSVVPIDLPPLRKRGNDISLLITFFLQKFNEQFNKNVLGFSETAKKCLCTYHWKGNIRELEHFIERMVILSKNNSYISINDLPEKIFNESTFLQKEVHTNSIDNEIGLNEARKIFETEFIKRKLKSCNWNQMETAKKLKIHRNTLIQKIKNLKITKPNSCIEQYETDKTFNLSNQNNHLSYCVI